MHFQLVTVFFIGALALHRTISPALELYPIPMASLLLKAFVLLALCSPLTAFFSASFPKLETQPRIASSSTQQFERRSDDSRSLCSSLQTRRRVPTPTRLHSSSSSSSSSKEKDDDSDEGKEPREKLIAQLKGTCVFLVGMMGSGTTGAKSDSVVVIRGPNYIV
jgi:hypothetical protein